MRIQRLQLTFLGHIETKKICMTIYDSEDPHNLMYFDKICIN